MDVNFRLFSFYCKLFLIIAQGNIRPEMNTTKSSWSSDSATNVDSNNYTVTQVPIRRDMAIWYSTVKGNFIRYFIFFCYI